MMQGQNYPMQGSAGHQAQDTSSGEFYGLIPYKNVYALIAYYLGIFSCIPGCGLLFAIPAIVLGILGHKAREANPAIKGNVHATIGIVLGSISLLVFALMFLLSLISSTAR